MKFPEKILLKLPDGTLGRIDAITPNRSEFIREVVLRELVVRGGVMPIGAKKKSFVTPDPYPVQVAPDAAKARPAAARSGRQSDAAELLSLIRSKRLSSRQAESEMGWLGLRYSNAENLLINSGAIVLDGGLLVAA